MTARINLAGQPAKAIVQLVNAGVVARADAIAHVKANIGRYTSKGASATKLARWTRCLDALAGTQSTPAPTYAKQADRKPKAAKAKAPKAAAPTFTSVGHARMDELLAKRILTNVERDELRALIVSM